MLRRFRWTLGIAAALAVVANDAQAQYYGGYGAFGWGGWGGGGATVQGDIARGLGMYNVGVGERNLLDAQATSINADTVVRFNQYLWLSQQEMNKRELLRKMQRQQTINATADSIHQRLRENPSKSDIANGDALNLVLDEITDPRIHSSALRMASEPLSSDVIDDIPFQNASEAVVFSLHQLTNNDWPLALQGDEYAPERMAWTQAVADALKEDESGHVTAKTLNRVKAAGSRLRAKFEASPPTDRAQLIEARNYIKTLLGLSRMLENPRVEKVLAELEKFPKTTLGNLLGFMHTYNLRFGPAMTAEQRTIYDDLYPRLVAHRDRVYKDTGIANAAPPKPKGRPTDFFQGMHLDHLEGKETAQ
jgi:hypothetical protein